MLICTYPSEGALSVTLVALLSSMFVSNYDMRLICRGCGNGEGEVDENIFVRPQVCSAGLRW